MDLDYGDDGDYGDYGDANVGNRYWQSVAMAIAITLAAAGGWESAGSR